jgi:DNA-binding GntR family transcriptional regulator
VNNDVARKQKAGPADVWAFLRDEILSQRLAPGASLLERSIAEQHGVSRTPVREALQRLEAEGPMREHLENTRQELIRASAKVRTTRQ